jgi:hypothetical protein
MVGDSSFDSSRVQARTGNNLWRKLEDWHVWVCFLNLGLGRRSEPSNTSSWWLC